MNGQSFRACTLLVLLSAVLHLSWPAQAAPAPRPMSFMDILEMRSVGGHDVSPDGKSMLYTLSVPDWKAGKSFTDVWLVSVEKGAASARQMTFTKEKNETAPRWSRDGGFFAFLSNREAPATAAGQNQLYTMRPDGGEARALSESKDGVGAFAFSHDGRWLAFATGKEEDQQLWISAITNGMAETPKQLTKHATPVGAWQFARDSRRMYFLAPDAVDKANKDRKTKRFDVRVRNEPTPMTHLWAFDLGERKELRLTSGTNYSVSGVTLSKDAKWIGFHGSSPRRFERNITDASNYADLYLLEVATGTIERLTENKDIAESALSFSPDGTKIAYSASDDHKYFHNGRVYVRGVSDHGGKWKKLGDGFDADASIGFWSEDSRTIYFNEGERASTQLFAISTESGKVTQITHEAAALAVSQDEDSKRLIIQHSSSKRPANIYTTSGVDKVADATTWTALTDSNPQVQQLALGETSIIQWKSTDGLMVEGILVKPSGFEAGKKYPLVVQIHGGPQSAVVQNFNANYSYYSHVYAGAGYICLLPNYRGSSNYGQKHRMQISGDYFRQGLVDGNRMGVMGWSAGGHWSNWILTHNDRFKAISSGAGAVNWISMYAESDTQRVREFYFGESAPYNNFEHYWEVSPLKYIRNAKTPTLIHVVDGDPRVPRAQSEELHMALKKLGVPTELLVYPGTTHGITEPRNQLVKMVSEFNWFEKYVRGKEGWFEWNDLLGTLKDEKAEKPEKKEPEEPK
jgi:dipeptidyl aminopeptidase/acylaminoacyl peptidase